MKTIVTWIKQLFEPKPTNADMVRFIRTEFANDTKHLQDADCISYYQSYLNGRRN